MFWGSYIFNIVFVVSWEGYIGKGFYGIIKVVLLFFYYSMCYEFKDKGIRIIVILLGLIWFDFWIGVDLLVDCLL